MTKAPFSVVMLAAIIATGLSGCTHIENASMFALDYWICDPDCKDAREHRKKATALRNEASEHEANANPAYADYLKDEAAYHEKAAEELK